MNGEPSYFLDNEVDADVVIVAVVVVAGRVGGLLWIGGFDKSGRSGTF